MFHPTGLAGPNGQFSLPGPAADRYRADNPGPRSTPGDVVQSSPPRFALGQHPPEFNPALPPVRPPGERSVRGKRWLWTAIAGGAAVVLLSVVVLATVGHHSAAPVDTAGAGATGSPLPASGAPVASAPAPSSPAASAAAKAPPIQGAVAGPGQWISVDAAAEAASINAFFAMKPIAITGNPTTVPEFHASCTVNHHGPDDPIVFPGVPGASHNHAFIGNQTTNANSTVDTLFAGATTCAPLADHSAYWIPTMYQNGKIVDPDDKVTVYYGSRLKDPSKTVPFPFGLRMISGDPRVQTDDANHDGNHFWCAGIGGSVGRTANGEWPICASTAKLTRQLSFPDCWDGKHLDSPDHKAHMSNEVNGACPADHPVPIPSLSFVIAYPLNTNMNGLSFSSGTGYSFHGDFFNAWDPTAQAQRVRNCVDQGVKCNDAGNFQVG
jgi:Domain of unknown function (DUF1996)